MILEKEITLYDYVLPIIAIENKFLIPKNILNKIADLKDIKALRKALMPYYPKLAEIAPPTNLEKIHFMLHADFIEKSFKVIQNSPRSARPFLMSFILEFEIENLKTIFRSKLLNISPSEISNKIHWQVEEFTNNKKIFTEMIKQNNFQKIFDLLNNTSYGEFIKKAKKSYEETNSFFYINTFLDYGHITLTKRGFEKLSKTDKDLASNYLNLLINYYNFSVLFRAKSFNLNSSEISKFLILEDTPILSRIIKGLLPIEGFSSLLQFVKNNNLGQKNSFLNFPETTNSFLDILEHIHTNFYKNCFVCFRVVGIQRPFSICSPLMFLLLKKFQLQDLMQISTGIDYGLPKNEILKRTFLLP
ncbi:MAG: V-type ATPase subunit [Candidatus Helarchaeota archaeon]